MTAALYFVAPGELDHLLLDLHSGAAATGPETPEAPGTSGTASGATELPTILLDGSEGHHAARVKRARIGEELLVADTAGMLACCRVSSIKGASLNLQVDAVHRLPDPEPRFTLAQALAKGGRDEQAVETATELGVDAVVAWQAQRSIVRWDGARADRAARALGKWVDQVRAAGKQARRARLPEVTGPVTTEQLAGRASEAVLTLVLHEDAKERLTDIPLPTRGEVLLVVGPEGGLAPAELDRLAEAGARIVRLGPEVLRSSSAGAAALAVLAARCRW